MKDTDKVTYSESVLAIDVRDTRISWGAVLAGVVIGLATQLLLTLFGIAIGASTIDPLRGDTPDKGLAVGAGVWLLISGIISAFIGARTAAYLSGSLTRANRVFHGMISWGLATLITAFFITTGVGNVLGTALGSLDKATTQEMVASNSHGNADRQFEPTGEEDVVRGGVQNEEQRREAADAAAKAATQAALWGSILLLAGALTSAFAAGFGRRSHVLTTPQPIPA